ncbi:19700_t:CDS:1, partial [Racocetra fulgida]
ALKRITELDLPSQSNPQILLYLQNPLGNDWLRHAHCQSGRIENEPNFSFILDYCFGELQKIKFVAVNSDKSLKLEPQDSAWNEQDPIGEFVTDIGSILGKSKGILKGNLVLTERPEKDPYQIIIVGRELPPKNGKTLNLKIQCRNLQLPKLAVGADVFYKLSSKIQTNPDTPSEMKVLYESERCYSKNPNWSVTKLSEGDLQNGGSNEEISFTCWQHKRGNHKCIGECIIKIDNLLSSENVGSQQISLSPKGELLLQCAFENTFLDYIAGGLEIKLNIAIDFTSSNRQYVHGIDLHNISLDETSYQHMIRLVGSVMESYDTNGQIPIYGFGGKFYGSGDVSHNFPLNQDDQQPEVMGISGVLEIYRDTLSNVTLSSPANFTPAIMSVVNRLQRLVDNNVNVYEVLLIITYGLIDDMESTIKAVMNASVLPLSIVIIGLGNADFTNLNTLANDFMSFNWDDLKPRNIVNFVTMKNFESQDQIDRNLPKAVLNKIPSQIMDYMLRRGITPRKQIRSETLDNLFAENRPPPDSL